MIPAALRGLADHINLLRWQFNKSHRFRNTVLTRNFQECASAWKTISQNLPKQTSKGEAWILSAVSGVWAYKLECMMAMALRIVGYRVRIVYFDFDPWREKYLSLAGIENWSDFRLYTKNEAVSDDVCHSFLERPLASHLVSLQYKNVDVGRIALSNHLYKNKFSRINFESNEFRSQMCEELRSAQRFVNASERLFNELKPDLALVIEKGLSPAAELFGYCVASQVPVIQFTNGQHADNYIFRRINYDNRHHHPFSLDKSTWDQVKAMEWSQEKENEILNDFEKDYKEGRWFGRKFLHTGKKIKSEEDVRRQLNLDPNKKTAVVFSHVLWDATFFYGKGIYEDYETWLVETVKAAAKNPNVNWIIKLHPDLVWKLKFEKVSGELRDILVINNAAGRLPPHVQIVLPETDIDTYSFFDITDICVTVRGTIGIEMACRGIPVITAGTGRYSGHGFTNDSATVEEYTAKLAQVQSLSKMSRNETELARRYAYSLFKLRPWSLKSFEVIKRKMEEVNHPLEADLRPSRTLNSIEDFQGAEDMDSLIRWLGSDKIDYLNQF